MNSRAPGRRPDIDHPSQEGWFDVAGHDITHAESVALGERFRRTDENVDELIAAVSTATLRMAMHRYTHERVSSRLLRMHAAQYADYKGYAGNPRKVGEYMRWFGRLAVVGFTYPEREMDPIYDQPRKKLALELGGKRQAGDWNCTGDLDAMIQDIPAQLSAVDPNIGVKSLLGQRLALNYLLTPMYNWKWPGAFDYALLRRRRAVFDVQDGPRLTRVFKESLGLVVMGQLEERERQLVYGPCTRASYKATKNDTPANAAGRVFEDIVFSRRDTATDIVPISAQYLMMAYAPADPNA
ncbi:MAG TPA: hypothetical protein VLE99_05550 [Candidatus Saccharimonadales bacterium]|nr:hypothetical protein [Candidatus Saccharimonadales bacterium]